MPKTTALVLVPLKPSMHPQLKARALELAGAMPAACPDLELTTVFDWRSEPRANGDCRPWSKVARIRNKCLDALNWRAFDFVVWVDADLTDYPADLPQWLIHGSMNYAGGGVCAPTVLIENVDGAPFAPDTFYDWSAFILKGRDTVEPSNRAYIPGRNIDCAAPYYGADADKPFVEMDCVGACYAVTTDVYRAIAADGIEGADAYFAPHRDHESFTDHHPICAKARAMGRKVVALPNVVARHAFLPKYGEEFH